jgi:hypothetical protein
VVSVPEIVVGSMPQKQRDGFDVSTVLNLVDGGVKGTPSRPLIRESIGVISGCEQPGEGIEVVRVDRTV